MSAPPTTLKSLAQVILKSNDATKRAEALLMIRRSDDPRVLRLLEQVQANDPDPGVRDLARNLLVKKQINTGLPTDTQSVTHLHSADATTSNDHSLNADTWTCDACGAPNSGGDVCGSCGTSYVTNDLYADSTPQTITSDDKPRKRKGAFLLNDKNRDFLEGRKGRPVVGSSSLIITVFMIPFVLIGIGIFVFAGVERERINTLNANGETTIGTVTARDIEHDSEDGDSYYVTYTFVANDREWTRRQSVSNNRYRSLEINATAEVIYLPGNPRESMLVGTNNHETSNFLYMFSIFWLVVSVPMFLGGLYFDGRRRALIKEGKVVIGEVTHCKGELDSDNDFMVDLHYQFQSPKSGKLINQKVHGHYEHLRDRPMPRPGTGVAILYRTDSHNMVL